MNTNQILPILIEEHFFIYPYTISPIFIDNAINMEELNYAQNNGDMIFIAMKKAKSDIKENESEFYSVGVVGKIMRKAALPNGKTKLLFQGESRARIIELTSQKPLLGKIEMIIPDVCDTTKVNATLLFLRERISMISRYSQNFPPDFLKTIEGYEPDRVVDMVLAVLEHIDKAKRHEIYSNSNTLERMLLLIVCIDEEIETIKLQKEIRNKVNSKIEKMNKKFFLKEQLKQIQSELGVDNESGDEEVDIYYQKLESIKPFIYEDAYREINKQIERFSRMSSDMGEANMLQNYIELMLEIPFDKISRNKMSIKAVAQQLDVDHYSLKKPKERICEYFAVRELLALRGKEDKQSKGTILCFYGPPGVGKTSLANSISKALKRPLIRIALGGLEDISELRGHRRTYLGAMPGRIVQGLINAKKMNPVIVLDEIDKVSKTYRGDPTSVLLEILDPEQNVEFRDYYANFNIDLSQIIFIATANDIAQIPEPLRDRMEFIALHSYTPQEKFEIAKKYLIPNEIKKHGMSGAEISINAAALKEIIEKYTREAGVRKLREQIAQIMRKCAKQILENKDIKKINITQNNVAKFLDKTIFETEIVDENNEIGVVNGLAWTSVGGDVLKIETIKFLGKGALELTGNLGDVMKESAKIALSVNKTLIDKKFKTKEQIYNKYNIHIHVPEGATPKDGPSAGIAMATAIASVLLNKKVRANIAMTGELTLSGKVLPIGGLKEKLIAAHKAGIKEVLIPEKNHKRDLDEMPSEVLENLTITPVTRIEEVLSKALV